MSPRASWPYRAAAVAFMAAIVAANVVAKLGPLGNWSAAFAVAANVTLIVATVAALIVGERRDRADERARRLDDY